MVWSVEDGRSGYQAAMECRRSQELDPRAFLVGGHLVEEDVVVTGLPCCACFKAADKADMVSSHAGRSQSSKMFLVLLKPLEGNDFLNFSKSSIAMVLVCVALAWLDWIQLIFGGGDTEDRSRCVSSWGWMVGRDKDLVEILSFWYKMGTTERPIGTKNDTNNLFGCHRPFPRLALIPKQPFKPLCYSTDC